MVVIPAKLKHTNIALSYLTGNCNNHPSVPGPTDEELLLIDTVSHNTGVIGIIVYQLPNCPIVYPSDPSHRGRGEDAMIAWVRPKPLLSFTNSDAHSSRMTHNGPFRLIKSAFAHTHTHTGARVASLTRTISLYPPPSPTPPMTPT